MSTDHEDSFNLCDLSATPAGRVELTGNRYLEVDEHGHAYLYEREWPWLAPGDVPGDVLIRDLDLDELADILGGCLDLLDAQQRKAAA